MGNVTKEQAAARADLRTLWPLVVEGLASEQEMAAHGLATEHTQQEVEERIIGLARLKHTHTHEDTNKK